MTIDIMCAEEKHIPQILGIEAASFAQPWTEAGFLNEISNDDAYFAVALRDNNVLGFLILHKFLDESELYKIAVDEHFRRCGVADQLMKAADDYIGENQISCVFLEVRESNKAAILLYEKYGFFSAGRRQNYYDKPTEDAVVMARKIHSSDRTDKSEG